MKQNNSSNIITPVLIGGSLILLISFAIRSTFGLFQIPIADQFLWARSEFSMAIAIQNLAWGIGTPIFSAFAEKFGDRKAITLGLILYAIGIFISSTASSPEAHQFLKIWSNLSSCWKNCIIRKKISSFRNYNCCRFCRASCGSSICRCST